jgi:cystathionine beta-lyase/cystathionine gamma-synthase
MHDESMNTFSMTRAVHAGRGDFAEVGVHAPPIDLSSTYPFPDLESAMLDFDALARGDSPPGGNPIYARLHNPTVRRFEEGLAELEEAEDAVAFASGMASLTAVLLAACREARHVVALRPLYGGSDHLLACGLLGLDVTWATEETVAESLRPDTGLVVLETPQNPTLGQVDIARVVAIAGDVPVVVDNTFATPVLQNPLRHGAAFSLHSATKFLGGHGDVLGGVVAASGKWASRLRRVRILTGALLHPVAGFLLHRSLPTLPLRVREAQANAIVLADRLAGHPAVLCVHYPTADGLQLRGPGAVLAFEVAGGRDAAERLLRSVSLITPAVSLGATDTLIEHPAGLTHHLLDPEVKRRCGVGEDLLRISVGLEDADDIWADLASALARSHAAAA